MARFQFPPSIASRPVYGTLAPRAGRHHLMVADAAGAEALRDLAGLDPALVGSAQVILIGKAEEPTDPAPGEGLNAAALHRAPTYASALPRLRRMLADAHMGLQLYLAGSEGLIGQLMQEALSAGIPLGSIQTEHRGSVARRVQCVHCKGITEDVMLDPFVCSHCGLNLFVRDHYSRRIAAFQGVCVDAEDPGDVPAQRELYS